MTDHLTSRAAPAQNWRRVAVGRCRRPGGHYAVWINSLFGTDFWLLTGPTSADAAGQPDSRLILNFGGSNRSGRKIQLEEMKLTIDGRIFITNLVP